MTRERSGVEWRKSSYSQSSDCVEVAVSSQKFIAIRDSKSLNGPELAFFLAEWGDFIYQLKAGQARG